MRQCAYIVDWDYIASVFFSPFKSKQDLVGHCTRRFSLHHRTGDLLLLSQYNMEVARCAQEPSGRAASLLASLNLQREQAQFCDCVVRLRQNPGQLHPAHRCVLAASSPVLSSILSSTGALVELQAPCLSDAVLGLLLDYIYTGVLPYARNHQYSNLLTAASYLQMDELQDTLRACKQTEVRAADNTNASTGAVSKYLPLSLDKEDHHYPANVDTCDDIDPCRTSAKNGTPHCTRSNASTLRNVNISCSVTESVNTTNCRLVTPQGLIQNIPCMADVHWVSEVDKEVQKDQFHSAGTEEELEKTVENRRSLQLICPAELRDETCRAEKQQPCLTVKSKAEEKQTNREEDGKTHCLHLSTPNLKGSVLPSKCPSSSSSPHPCCGAVPVIRHSSKTACLQLAKMPMAPLPNPVSQASISSSRNSHSRSGSTDSIVEGINTIHNDRFEEQNQHYRNNKGYIGTQSWDYKHSSDQSDILDQDYNCSNTDHLIEQNDEHMRNGLSHITDDNVHHAHCDSFQNMNHRKHIRDASMPQNNNVTSGFQYETDLSFDDIPSKHHRLDCSDCHNVWMETAAEEQPIHSQDPRAIVTLPVQDSDTGSDSHNEELCSNGEAKEEHCYSRCASETGRQESISDNVAGGLSGFERKRMSGIEITEPHIAFTMPVNHNMADPSVGGPSYRGHLQYHCLLQEDVHFSHGYSGRNLVGTFASNSPLRQQVATGTTDQVLLLDISDQRAELLVANAFNQKVTFGHGFGNNNEDQWNEETSVVVADNKYWETNMNKGKSVGKDQSRPGAKVIHKAGVMGGDSNPKDSGNQATTLTVSSPPSEPDSVQASMPSVLSIGIPSSLSASMPTNISARLSSPIQHPFQCSLCNRSFSQRGSLNRHVRSHLGVRPFPCPCCPMTFSRQYRVTEHMRVHQRCVLRNDFQKPPALRLERPQK